MTRRRSRVSACHVPRGAVRVLVFDTDKRCIGHGRIVGHVDVFGCSSPRIRLDSGRIIHGYESWWRPV